jgi:decaprenyl-phosphate phosphoribosyltransferase
MMPPQDDGFQVDATVAAGCHDDSSNAPESRATEAASLPDPRLRQALRYVAIARPHHYAKNILVLVGVALAYFHQPDALTNPRLLLVGWGLLATCLIASSNYVLNEILDASSDRFHRHKSDRPIAAGYISPAVAYGEWLILGVIGQSIAAWIGSSFFAVAIAFQLMAILYNVPPVRLKDLPYLDVLSEAVNSPLRLLLGWLIVLPSELPSLWLILVFWMAGAFEMARKRLKEYRFFQDRTAAAGYRRSFAHYDERHLKSSMAVYASVMAVFGLLESAKLWPLLAW